MTTFSIGADPEIFLRRNGKAFSAHGVIPGTKKEPHKVDSGAIQVDGMAVEFNIDPVNIHGEKSLEQFNGNVTRVLKQMKDEVKKHDPALSFNIESVQEFDQETFDEAPKEAKELGCDPDFNAYTKEQNPAPNGEVNFRTASGHIHVGWGDGIPVDHPDHIDICADFIKKMDCFVGMYMTIIDPESRRRDLYGKAGAFRPKPYGVEYRTPSNLWLTNKTRREAIFRLTEMAVSASQNQYSLYTLMNHTQLKAAVKYKNTAELKELLDKEAEAEIQDIINTGDFVRAKTKLTHMMKMFWAPTAIRTAINDEYNNRLAKKTDGEAGK